MDEQIKKATERSLFLYLNTAMSKIKIQISRVRPSDLPLPRYMTDGSAGLDLYADVDVPLVIAPHEVVPVPTGLCFAIPQGFEGQIRPRSGLAAKNGITVINTPGTIDSDYRGEVKILLINLSKNEFEIKRGERVAQIIFSPVVTAELELVDNLGETLRGSGGFGHTGK